MLVLLRKKNESLVINNDITVTVVDILDEKVRIGIVAPKDMPVHRQEVHDVIHGPFVQPIQIAEPKPRLVDPWAARPDDDPASASSNERRSHFLGRIAWNIREKSAQSVTLANIAGAIIDAVQESGMDLNQANSLEHLKRLLLQRLRRQS